MVHTVSCLPVAAAAGINPLPLSHDAVCAMLHCSTTPSVSGGASIPITAVWRDTTPGTWLVRAFGLRFDPSTATGGAHSCSYRPHTANCASADASSRRSMVSMGTLTHMMTRSYRPRPAVDVGVDLPSRVRLASEPVSPCRSTKAGVPCACVRSGTSRGRCTCSFSQHL